jgi:MFS family permease
MSFMEPSEGELQKRKEKIQHFLFGWVKDNYDKAFIGVLLLAIVIRVYFLLITLNQTVWWDSADYLTEAKVLGKGLDIGYQFIARRTFLMPLLWAGLMKLGFGEVSFRILEFLFSIAAIPATYLIGKEMFNKKIGLLSSFLMAIFWMHLFYSNRLMTEVPTLTFLLFSTYFFWKGYTKKNEKMFIWFGIFLGLAFLARAGTLVMFAVFPIFLLITERLKFLKRKYLWIGIFCTLLLMSSFFIYTSYKQHLNAVSYFLALTPETSGGTPRFSNLLGFSGITQYFALMPHYFDWVLLILFLFGILILSYNVFISFDIIIKRKNSDYDKYLFILIFALVPFLFQATLYHYVEDRYIMNAFPAFFLALSLGLVEIEKFFNKYKKHLGLFVVILLLAFGAYQQFNTANLIIKGKITSYAEVKEAGLWLKENSAPSDVVISRSVPQNSYYSERKTLHIPEDKAEFESLINKENPQFLILSIFEPHPQWAYAYPQEHNATLIPVQAYQQGGQPVLIIYKFDYSNKPSVK